MIERKQHRYTILPLDERTAAGTEKAVRVGAVGVLCLCLLSIAVTEPAFALWIWQGFKSAVLYVVTITVGIYLAIDVFRACMDTYSPLPEKGWIGIEVQPAEVTAADFASQEEYERFTTHEAGTDEESQAEQWEVKYNELKEKEKKQNETMKQRAEKLRLELNEQEQ